MRWQIEFRTSAQPEEWVPLRKAGGNTLIFEDTETAYQRRLEFVKLQPHIPARVVPVYG